MGVLEHPAEPLSPAPEPPGPHESAGSSPDAWIGDILMACDAARAAGLFAAEIDSSPSASPAEGERDLLASRRLALARACLDRLHRRWPWPGVAEEDDGGDLPLAGLGLTLGRYTLLNLIGSGGHGLVFLAEDRTLRRRVALKVPRPEWLASERHRQRFLREAQALARLDHPGIVPIHDYGESGSVCYLATAYVDGPSLTEWLAARRERVSARLAGAVALSLAEAVAHAHSRGVLHRDLKPGNVLVERGADPDAPPVIRITDFGLAKLLDDTRGDPLTETLAFGTPRYMAPEQAAADRARIGPPADVYGLGAVLHTISTGAAPEGPVDASCAVFSNRQDAPESLRQIVARCLQRTPEDRYPTVRELAVDLKRFLDGEPVAAPRLGRGAFRRRWGTLSQGYRFAIVALAASLASLAIAFAGLSRRPGTSVEPVPGSHVPERVKPGLGGRDHDRYVREMQRADRRIRERFDSRTADSEWLDHWSGPFGPGEADPRGFEWGYLKNLGHAEWLTLRHPNQPDGKPVRVYHAQFSPDGKRLISASNDGKARIWDAATGTLLRLLDHGDTEVNVAVFSPDGSRIATTADDGGVRIWDGASGALILPITKAHSDEVSCLAFTPDGRRMVSGSLDSFVAVWDAATGNELDRHPAGVDRVQAVVISRDGKFAVVQGEKAGGIAILNLGDYSLRWHPVPGGHVAALDLAPDNRWIATSRGGDVTLLDLAGRAPEMRLSEREDGLTAVAFSPDQTNLAAGTGDPRPLIKLWHLADDRARGLLRGHTGRIWSITYSPDGGRLATSSEDGTVKIWDLARRPDRTIFPLPAGVAPLGLGVAFQGQSPGIHGPSHPELVTVTREGRVNLMDGDSGQTTHSRVAFGGPIAAARISPDGSMIAGVSADGMLTIADAHGKHPAVTVRDHKVNPDGRCLAFDQSGRLLVAEGPEYREIRGIGTTQVRRTDRDKLLIETTTARVASTLRGGSSFAEASFTFYPDGRRFATHDAMGWNNIAAWDFVAGQARRSPDPDGLRDIRALAISPDARFIATGDVPGIIQLTDAETLAPRIKLFGHRSLIVSLAFSPDSRRLASGDTKGAVMLWDVDTGEELLELEGLAGNAHFLQFAPDGLSLVGASADNGGRFVVWHGRMYQSEPAGQARVLKIRLLGNGSGS